MSRTHAHAPLFVKHTRYGEETHDHSRIGDGQNRYGFFPDACTINEHSGLYAAFLTHHERVFATCYYALPYYHTQFFPYAPRGAEKRHEAAKFRRRDNIKLRSLAQHYYHGDDGEEYDDEFITRSRVGWWD